MLRSVKLLGVCVAACALVSLRCGTSLAGTIIKMSLSAAPADIVFDGTTLSTIDDGDVTTTGSQNTSAIFLDFLDPKHADILPPDASFTLSGLTTNGLATPFPAVSPVLVIQDFTGGTFDLYDTDNTLLLSGALDDSTLTGPIGPPATGGLFTTSFALVTGGSLKPYINDNSLTLSMNFTQISNGVGFSLGGAVPALYPFTADASANITGEIPEPATGMLLMLGMTLLVAAVRGRG